MPENKTKRRYRALSYTALDSYGTFQQGELIDSDQVPQEVLDNLQKDGLIEYVDTVKWHVHAGVGAWEAEPEADQPQVEPEADDDKPKEPEAKEKPKDKGGK